MAQTNPIHNPFMLMLQPEIVLAAMEKSERLNQLNRHLCRPLDKPALANARAGDDGNDDDSSDDIAADDAAAERQ
jgi:hypothetical protein